MYLFALMSQVCLSQPSLMCAPLWSNAGVATDQGGATTPIMLMLISVVVSFIGLIYAWNRFSKKPELEEARGFGKVLADKWYVDEFYNFIIVRPLNALSKFLNDFIEKSVIEGTVKGVGRVIQYSSRQIRLLQSGQVGGYVLLMVIGIVILFLVQLFLMK